MLATITVRVTGATTLRGLLSKSGRITVMMSVAPGAAGNNSNLANARGRIYEYRDYA
jgi:hypothetical protein